MAKAVQFDSYGGVAVLEVRDVARPVPAAGEVLVEVRAARLRAAAPSGHIDAPRRGRRSPPHLLDASIIGAAAVTLATSYAFGDRLDGNATGW